MIFFSVKKGLGSNPYPNAALSVYDKFYSNKYGQNAVKLVDINTN